MRILFCGTPEFAVPSLRRLLREPEFELAAVFTQPDKPRGRGGELAESPVKQVAAAAGIPIHQPVKLGNEEMVALLRAIAPQAVVIIAYGRIIPASLLDIPPLGWINLHASLLPKYRGAAPIQWAIASGETRTGLTTMRIDAGMDTGPTLLRWETEIGPEETAPQLAARMGEAGAQLIVDTLRRYACGEISPRPQDHSQATLAPMLHKEDGRADWSLPAQTIYNRMRGFDPWPGCYTVFRGQTCHVWGRPAEHALPGGTAPPGSLHATRHALHVACGARTWLELAFLQLEGRKRVAARDFLNGVRLREGERFGH